MDVTKYVLKIFSLPQLNERIRKIERDVSTYYIGDECTS